MSEQDLQELAMHKEAVRWKAWGEFPDLSEVTDGTFFDMMDSAHRDYSTVGYISGIFHCDTRGDRGDFAVVKKSFDYWRYQVGANEPECILKFDDCCKELRW